MSVGLAAVAWSWRHAVNLTRAACPAAGHTKTDPLRSGKAALRIRRYPGSDPARSGNGRGPGCGVVRLAGEKARPWRRNTKRLSPAMPLRHPRPPHPHNAPHCSASRPAVFRRGVFSHSCRAFPAVAARVARRRQPPGLDDLSQLRLTAHLRFCSQRFHTTGGVF
jgi:hypothetical protein